jgi:serine/threonine-protein phosphatase 2A activator
MLESIVPCNQAYPEIKTYLLESFGSFERIDYGTGHELNFVAFLLCLFKLGLFKQEDFKSLINKVFQRYLLLMRKIQLIYVLEPAGSHGVWGLDDYQHLAFFFGASQLVKNERGYTPDSIHSEGTLLKEQDDYMYFGCIAFIK